MKTVLVTGGSSGIGAAACRLAARGSWSVFVGYRGGEERARALAAEIEKDGGRAWPVRLPLEDPAAVDAALELVAARAGRLDALVLCASPAPELQSFTKTTAASLEEQFRVNVAGSQRLIAGAWRRFFSKQKAGHVVAVLSEFAGSPPQAHMTSYVVAKRALLALLECALSELGAGGLRASAVVPGYTDTPMTRGLNPHILEAARSTQSGARFLPPERVAELIVGCLERAPSAPGVELHAVTNRKAP